jgi:S1-C subfamily serine protease
LNTFKSKLIAVLAVAVIALSAYGIGAGDLFSAASAEAAPVLFNEDTVTNIYNLASPAVVEIDLTQGSGSYRSTGLGSGILIDTEGYILTNQHVVDGATSVRVNLDNGDNVAATVVGTDAIDDLALIKVDAPAVAGITPLTLGDSSAVKPGQMAIAIGNPFGLDDTVTVGIISGLDRRVGNLSGMLQTDASINPGNSGGPLLDANGLVIGINTAIETSVSGATGIGFAVPSNVAVRVLPSLRAGTTVTRPWLGISGMALTGTLAQELGLSITEGVYVASVNTDSPAAAAGLKGADPQTGGGDVITAIDGSHVASVPDISNYINSNKKVGDVVTLSVLRAGSQLQVQVTLGAWPDNLTNTLPRFNIPQLPDQLPDLPFGPWRHDRQPDPED